MQLSEGHLQIISSNRARTSARWSNHGVHDSAHPDSILGLEAPLRLRLENMAVAGPRKPAGVSAVTMRRLRSGSG